MIFQNWGKTFRSDPADTRLLEMIVLCGGMAMNGKLWVGIAYGGMALTWPVSAQTAAAQDLTPEEVRRIGEQRKLIERDQVELEGRFTAMEAAQRSGNCFLFQSWYDLINRFLDNQIGQYGPPTGLAVRRNVFQAGETRLARTYALGCPLPVSGAPPAATAAQSPEQLRADTGAPQSSPEADDLDAIVDDPDASLGPQGLAPEDRESEVSVPTDFGFSASPKTRPSWLPITGPLDGFGGFDIGIGRIDIPDTGIGFMRGGPPGEAPEEHAGTTPDEVDFVSVEGVFQFIVEGMPVRITLGYAEGDGSNRFEVPGDAGIDSGRVNGAPAPSGSSGIATPFGLSGGAAVDYTRYRSMFDLGVYSGGSWSASWQDQQEPALAPGYGASIWFGYERLERDYTAFAEYSGGGPPLFFEFSQDREQAVTDDIFSAGLRGAVAIPVGRGLVGHLAGSAGGYYLDSDLDSIERNLCNFCPPEDQDFTVAIGDSNNGFGFSGEAGAGMEFVLSPRISLLFDVSAEYWSRIGAIFNPNSGDQVFFEGLTTELRTDDMRAWRVGGGIVIRLGGPGS